MVQLSKRDTIGLSPVEIEWYESHRRVAEDVRDFRRFSCRRLLMTEECDVAVVGANLLVDPAMNDDAIFRLTTAVKPN